MKVAFSNALMMSAAPMVLGACLISGTAFAQDTAKPGAPKTEEAQTIVVTGSLIKQRTSTESISPITTVTADQLDARGISTVQEGLQTLAANNGPALTNSFTANGAFAAGASAISLRGLSTNSTLVLFDGLRAAYYPLADDGSRNFVDLNTIPDDIIEKVDVLKDGASSAYGADAIAGVVNIKTKRQFKGVAIRAEGGLSSRADAGSQRLSLTVGKGDIEENGYNAYFSTFYFHQNALYNRDRPYPFNTANYGGLGNNTNGIIGGVNANGQYVQGTPTSSIFYVRPYDATNTNAQAARYTALNAAQCAGRSSYTLNAADLARTANANAPTSVCQVDYTASYGVIQPEIKRYGGSAKVTAKLNDTIEAYAEFNFLQTSTDFTGQPAVMRSTAPAGIYYQQFATSTSGGIYVPGSGNIALPVYVCNRNGVAATMVNGVPTVPGCTAANGRLNPNNPYAAQGYVARIQGRDLSSTTYNETRNRTYRGAFGVSGQLTDAITFDVGGTAMHDDLRRLQKGYVYIQHLLDAVADGSYNFLNPSANTQAVNDYVKPDSILNATSDQVQLQANLGFKVADLPGGPLQVAVGGSERYEAVDTPSGNNDINGPTQRYFTLNAFGTKGHRWIHSAYGEISVPVVKQLELTAAGRYDSYSSGQNAFSPKAGFKFKPVKQLMIRGTWSKGFRIPSFGEANSLPTTGYVGNTQGVFNDKYLAQYGCTVATFSSCPSYLSAGSYGYTQLATPTLKSEKSRSFTLGAVFEPVRNLSFTVDFYDIKKDQLITAPLAAPALTAYYAGAPIPAGYTVTADAPDPNFPNATPKVALVLANLINANSQTVRGMDFEAEFRHKFGRNVTWTSSAELDWIMLLETKFSDGHTERYDGTLGNYNLTAGSGTPSVKATWMNTLEIGKVKITDTLNYISGYNLSAMDQGGSYKDCSLAPAYWTACNVKGLITTDVNVQVKVNDQFTVYGTVNNLLNQMPPIDPVTYGAHGYNAVQGGTAILGRYFKVGAKVNF